MTGYNTSALAELNTAQRYISTLQDDREAQHKRQMQCISELKRERDEAYGAIRLLMNRKPHENANIETHSAVRRAMEQGENKEKA